MKYPSLNHPHLCILCGHSTPSRLCDFCRNSFFITQKYRCYRCAEPLPALAYCCKQCMREPPYFDATHCFYNYAEPLSLLIHRFKQQKSIYIGKALAEIFASQLNHYYQQHHIPLPDLLCPVPLHWIRLWKRGFNQSQFIAQTLNSHFKIPILRGLSQVKHVPHQKRLKRTQRLQNLAQAYQLKADINLHGMTIAIVDDVITTGATVNTIAKQLKLAGAKEVVVLAIAKTALNPV